MQQLVVDLALPADQFVAWYKGQADRVLIRSRDGRSISLPAHHLRPFLTHEGVYGSFVLTFTGEGRLVSLERLG